MNGVNRKGYKTCFNYIINSLLIKVNKKKGLGIIKGPKDKGLIKRGLRSK